MCNVQCAMCNVPPLSQLAAQACLPNRTMDIVVALALTPFAYGISLDWCRIGIE
jgi:hypothetical protein